MGGVGAIAVAVALWSWWTRRNAARRAADENSAFAGQPVALEKYSIAVPLRSEMDGQNLLNEASATPEPRQLAAHHGASELEG